jgi:hypothetical protein
MEPITRSIERSGHRVKTTKFGRYADKFETRPFLHLLAHHTRVTEKAVLQAYGFTTLTKSWPGKLSLIATKARRELLDHGITLPRAANRRGWSLSPEDRAGLANLLEQSD